MTREDYEARVIAAELFTYAREVEALTGKYPELAEWVDRIREGALDVVKQAGTGPR